jgi:hypothetical protein
MRGTLQARLTRLTFTIGRLPRPSWPALATLRPRQLTGEELETIERLSSELRRARRSGGYQPEPVLQRPRR